MLLCQLPSAPCLCLPACMGKCHWHRHAHARGAYRHARGWQAPRAGPWLPHDHAAPPKPMSHSHLPTCPPICLHIPAPPHTPPRRSRLPPSPQEVPLQGLSLLRLLVQNRVAEFHTELELITPEVENLYVRVRVRDQQCWYACPFLPAKSCTFSNVNTGTQAAAGTRRRGRHQRCGCPLPPRVPCAQVQALPQVAHILQLERWLMEGAYNKVLSASRAGMATDLHGLLIGQLASTVRWAGRVCGAGGAGFVVLAACCGWLLALAVGAHAHARSCVRAGASLEERGVHTDRLGVLDRAQPCACTQPPRAAGTRLPAAARRRTRA